MITARLFVALVPPPAVRAELAAVGELLVDARVTLPENVHLTLRFIGDTAAEREAGFIKALARVHVEPFVLPVGTVGVFPSRGHANVVWAGVGNGHTRLFQLRKQVDEALLSVDSSLTVSSFHPHFTLGRLGENHDPKALARFRERFRQFEAPPFRVSEFLLMASESQPGHTRAYRTIHNYSLNEKQ